jgi:hypothetical protein
MRSGREPLATESFAEALCFRFILRSRTNGSDACPLRSDGEVFLPGQFVDTSIPASVPAGLPADVAFGDSGYANTTNSCPTYSACEGNLRDRGCGVCLMKRRWRHGLRRRCDG